jgi:hypothetical protein
MKGFTIKTVRFAFAAACISGLAACSAEVTAPPINVPPLPPPQPAAKAMSVEGNWASQCIFEQGMYTRQILTFYEDTIKIKVDLFSNSGCAGAAAHTVNIDGTLIRVGASVYVSGGHDVQATLKQPDGAVEQQKIVILVEGGKLFTSDIDALMPGQWPNSVDRKNPFFYIGG